MSLYERDQLAISASHRDVWIGRRRYATHAPRCRGGVPVRRLALSYPTASLSAHHLRLNLILRRPISRNACCPPN